MASDYSNITVVGIHGNGGAERLIPAIEKTAQALPGSQTLLITDRLVNTHIPQHLLVSGLNYSGYSHFVVYCLHSFINTEFVLIVQDDGWALNPKAWQDEFMNYDYIGGLTHAGLKDNKFYKLFSWVDVEGVRVVQNGGFSLRSKRLLEAPSKYGIVMTVVDQVELNNEDIQLCCFMRPALEAVGLKFAPNELSKYFSFEHLYDRLHNDMELTQIFGHHSRFRRLKENMTMEWLLTDDEMKMIVWEDKALQLFKNYGYKICYPNSLKEKLEPALS